MHVVQAQVMQRISHVTWPSLGLKTFENSYLTLVHHVVCCVDQETEIQENCLLQNTSSYLDDQHIYYVAHSTPCYSFFYLTFFHDLKYHICVMR